MNVLVTGAAGFIGACAVRSLLDRGDDVAVLLRDRSAWRLADVRGRLRVHAGDLREPDFVHDCLTKTRPDVIVHLACHGAYEHQSSAVDILTTNIIGSQNLFEAAAEHGVSLVVQAGSSSEYGYRDSVMCESDRLEPNSDYAVAKAAQTHLGQLWSRRGIAVVTLRLFSVYGPWEEPTRLVPTLLRRARDGAPLDLADPDTARDFVYVDDVLDAMLDFTRLQSHGGEVFNISSGRETKLREIVDEVLEVTGSRSECRWGKFPARRWDATTWCGDIAKAALQLGWSPKHSLRDGLSKTLDWMNRALVQAA